MCIRDRHTVCTIADCLIRVHVSVYAEVVGEYESLESPFVAEYCVAERCISACPLCTDVVEGGHYSVCAAFFYSELKRFQVDLADRLLVRPCTEHAVSVRLLII